MKAFIGAITASIALTVSLAAQAEIRDYSDFLGSGVGGNRGSIETFEFVKNAQRLCKAERGFFTIKCSDKEVGRKADSLNAQIGDYCDAMVRGETTIYRLADFYNTAGGANYLAVHSGNECQLLTKVSRNPEPARQSSLINKKDLVSASILGQNAEVQPAQLVVKNGQSVHWVTIYKSEVGIPVVELRDDRNVRLVVDRYLLAKANENLYESVVGFRSQNCAKMAAENHDTFDQIQTKNHNESCLQIVGKNGNGQYINLAILPTSKLKKHLFRSIDTGWVVYTVEEEYSQADFLLDLLTAIFGS